MKQRNKKIVLLMHVTRNEKLHERKGGKVVYGSKRIKNTKQNKQKETQHPTLVTKSG